MTKKQMIEKVQALEASLFLKMKKYEKTYGKESELHKMARTRWCGVEDVMKELDIKLDTLLPDNMEAMKIVDELWQERIAVAQFEQEDFDKRDIGL